MNKFTHKIKSSGQKCYQAAKWPTTDKTYIEREKSWPLMVFESGQVDRVRRSNLKLIGD